MKEMYGVEPPRWVFVGLQPNHIIPPHIKHLPDGPNYVEIPCQTLVSKGVFNIRGMGLPTANNRRILDGHSPHFCGRF
jgi:hypothetical protein